MSDASDAHYQETCNHSHDVACRNCESLKDVVGGIEDAISKCAAQLGKVQAHDLQYEAKGAASKVNGAKTAGPRNLYDTTNMSHLA